MPAILGLSGSTCIALASYSVGPRALVRTMRAGLTVLDRRSTLTANHGMWALYFAGLVLLSIAFLLLGRGILGRDPLGADLVAQPGGGGRLLLWAREPVRSPLITWQQVRLCALLWALPIVCAAPVGSSDLWAYAAQGNVYAHGFNPYIFAPRHVPNAYFAATARSWRGTPAPYGPLYLLLARAAVDIAGTHVYVAVVILKIVAAIGYLAVVLALPRLCRVFGCKPDRAMWLFAANPLVLVIALGGGHNDLVMAGLIAVGMVLLVGRGSILTTLLPAAVVLAAASEVKVPAAIVLAFLPMVWFAYAPAARAFSATRRRALWQATGLAVLAAVATALVVVLVTGLGFGWVHRLGSADIGIPWLSLPIVLVLAGEFLRGRTKVHLSAIKPTHAGQLIAGASAVLAVLIIIPLWWSARRGSVLVRLTVALLAGLMLSTSVQPWYFCWPLLFVGLITLPAAAAIVVAGLSLGLTAGVAPSGVTLLNTPTGFGLMLLLAGLTWIIVQISRETTPAPAAA